MLVTPRKSSGLIAEFAPALCVLLFLALMPMLDLMALAVGAGITYMMAMQVASQASKQQTFTTALTAAVQESGKFSHSGFANFTKLVPVGGYQQSGANLYVVADSFRNSGVHTFPANMPATPPVDPSTFVYEYQAKVACDVGPLIVMSGIPWINHVPGLGVPARLTFSSFRAAEFPDGVAEVTSVASNPNQEPALGPNIMQTTNDPPLPQTGWNLPYMYESISALGEQIIEIQVLQVYAIDSNWTDTGVGLTATNQQIWFDSHANGLWSPDGVGLADANGVPSPPNQPSCPMPTGPGSALIGRIGNNPPFKVGRDYANYRPGQVGELYLIFNDCCDCYADNTGSQTVRIIVTQ